MVISLFSKRKQYSRVVAIKCDQLFCFVSAQDKIMARDPYPFVKYENDDDFMGPRNSQVKTKSGTLQGADDRAPWTRLYKTATLASARREVFHYDPQAPNDSLDFVIKSQYDHHGEFLSSKAQTLFQPETVGTPHGRILKNRPGPEEPTPDLENLPLNLVVSDKKQSLHSVKGAIPSHHSAATNGGYSRKHDGGFYTC